MIARFACLVAVFLFPACLNLVEAKEDKGFRQCVKNTSDMPEIKRVSFDESVAIIMNACESIFDEEAKEYILSNVIPVPKINSFEFNSIYFLYKIEKYQSYMMYVKYIVSVRRRT